MNKAKFITLLLAGSVIFLMQGCSYWKGKDEQIRPYKQFVYNFEQPRRMLLPSNKARQLQLPSAKINTRRNEVLSPHHYYSANGNICRLLNVSGSEIVCAVSGQWQSSPAVLASSLRR